MATLAMASMKIDATQYAALRAYLIEWQGLPFGLHELLGDSLFSVLAVPFLLLRAMITHLFQHVVTETCDCNRTNEGD
jgi:hypothetical protein